MFRDKYKTIIIPILMVGILLPLTLYAVEMQTDLNGFRLGQFKNAVSTTLGKPFEAFNTDYSTVEAYRLDDKAYMVFEYLKQSPNNIYSIQLTGATDNALPFVGLKLGDDSSKVIAILGKPSHTEKINSPKVTKFEYDGTNYTIEVDDKDKLYSIRIFSTKDLIGKTDEKFTAWDEFRNALIAKNTMKIIAMLRPDVEIYRKGKVLSINHKYSDFVEKPDKDIIAALMGDNDSVLKEITESEPEAELRLLQNVGVGEVYKFYEGKILKEIVFFPYNGINRVYEIDFRE
jgi:hypothetical protein